jgi:hypothetical protein
MVLLPAYALLCDLALGVQAGRLPELTKGLRVV